MATTTSVGCGCPLAGRQHSFCLTYEEAAIPANVRRATRMAKRDTKRTPRTLRDFALELDASDRRCAILALRSFGEGGHPYPDDETLPFFAVAYVRGCLARALRALDADHPDVPAARVALAKIVAATEGL